MNAPPNDDDQSRRNRANIAAAIVVAALAAGAFWLVKAIEEHQNIENCLASGRHDCVAPIEQSSGAR